MDKTLLDPPSDPIEKPAPSPMPPPSTPDNSGNPGSIPQGTPLSGDKAPSTPKSDQGSYLTLIYKICYLIFEFYFRFRSIP